MKSGLMEIADFFVVNKSDREGADQAVRALKTILTFRITHKEDEWIPPVIKTAASKNVGIDAVLEEIEHAKKVVEEESGSDDDDFVEKVSKKDTDDEK